MSTNRLKWRLTGMDAERTLIVFRLATGQSEEPHEVIELELDDEISESEIEKLLWPEGASYPVYYEYEQQKKGVNWGASAALVDWVVTLESLPNAGDWFLFGLAHWLGRRQRRHGEMEVPDEEAGERTAKQYLVVKRPPIGVNDLRRVEYELDRDAGLGTYRFLAPEGVRYEVKVSSGPGGVRVRYMREILNLDAD